MLGPEPLVALAPMANEDAKTEPKKKTGKTKASPKKAAAKAAPNKGSAKKSSKKAPEFGAKSDFIRLQPKHMTAKAVVEAGKAMGLIFSDGLVYAVRGASKKSGGGSAKATLKKTAAKAKRGNGRSAAGSSGESSTLESDLRRCIAELGLARARAIFSEVERAFAGG